MPLGSQQAPRRRIRRAHAAAPVDDEHAVLHLLDHQAVELGLLTRHLQAAARRLLLARQPPRQFAGQDGDDEEPAAGQPRLRHQQRRLAARRQAEPRGGSRISVTPAAVARASSRGVRMPAISTGRTSSAW